MDQQTQPPTMPQSQPGDKSVGPAIGTIIIIIIVILGGLYFWGQRISEDAMEVQETAPQAENMEFEQSNSDELSSIEADLQATNFDSLGTEINSAEAEANASGE